ncbi:hypothetical protein NEF87_002547 [Candidatus Lokiarchaeum ossiferum]|uniref:Transcription factor Pcc1 n=1 Tax=Candidatus Lokiarchaeum ossiferum TaxID=2951803 RepID=A0ABY6HRX0_9ARCH|nr:hypothetical protein NEF87_002547 [Candidatus Lokiarchaeum sp. B-35]
MKISTQISFQFDSPEDAQIFYASFLPEFNDMPLKRSHWQVNPPKSESSVIQFHIHAEDATAFRATINSLIQFAHIVEKTIHLTSEL